SKTFIWNETLTRKVTQSKNEILLMTEDVQLLQAKYRLEKLGITVNYREEMTNNGTDEEIETWLKTKNALAIFCPNDTSQIRIRATAFNVLVFSEVESLIAFSMMTNKQLNVNLIESFQKEIVYQ